jgi:hypothetical protein
MTARLAFLASILSAGMIGAQPGQALEYAPDCYLQDSTGQRITVKGDNVGYYAQDIGGGFVTYFIGNYPEGSNQSVVEHCPSTERLTAISNPNAEPGDLGDENAISRLLNSYLDSDEKFTLKQMATGLDALGAETTVEKTGKKSCACRLRAAGRLGEGASEPEIVD